MKPHNNLLVIVATLSLILQSVPVTATFKLFGSPKLLLARIGNHEVIVPDLFGLCVDRSWAAWCISPDETTTEPPDQDNNDNKNEDKDEMIAPMPDNGGFIVEENTTEIDLARFWLEDMCSSVMDDPSQELQLLALAKIYYQFDTGPNISSSATGDRWLSNCKPCTWGGVGCNLERQVVELVLASSGLSGQISPYVGLLDKLRVLDLRNNIAITGTIPEQLGMLTGAASMRLSGTSLTGSMPKSVCDLVNLVDLGSDCAGDDPAVVCDCCTYCSTFLEVDDRDDSPGWTTILIPTPLPTLVPTAIEDKDEILVSSPETPILP